MKTWQEKLDSAIDDIVTLLCKKHHDYGDTNLQKFGLLGILIRLSDKCARLETLILKKNKQMVTDETVQDTLRDIAGYALQGLILFGENDGNILVEHLTESRNENCTKIVTKGRFGVI